MGESIYKELTWYDTNTVRPPVATSLRESIRTSACVVGGGFAGLTCALELARRGVPTMLVEAGRIGSGASGRNGGFVYNGFSLGPADLVSQAGADSAKNLYQLSRMGTEYVRNEILSGDPSIKMGEGLQLVLRIRGADWFDRHYELLNETFGERVALLDRTGISRFLKTSRYYGAIQFQDAFHIHPLKYAVLLQRNCESMGVRIHENSKVLAAEKQGQKYVLTLEDAEIQCDHVVFCVSASDKNLHKPTGRAVLPVVTYAAVTQPIEQDVINTECAVADTRRAGDYYRLVDDGRILWGGRITTRLSRPSQLATTMRDDLLSVYPEFQFPRIDYAWAGQMAYSVHKMPLIGRDEDGCWFATAFGGHGLNTTAMAGQLIARAIADDDDRYRQFTPFAPQWAYGQLGRLGVQGAYWYMQAKDRFEESRVR